ncbi:autophagy cysteine endopeptidase Atg4 [Aspergillus eucalypticola CBS 122712]|uniref:Cysteine protease n=1 Tax=Aspergillus eucalypticola (strain CBS 122712 / IBT 29274) TaxID=1448314 RepID=A0A317UVR3_ASPEC|nr:autophagy cysteine endopeptidase Atg4 [Aspergillus eucalypticola CBS 122712]PWY66163.1 autophagy cysteine endopeptidase Atg4 [Aspergillus eucalypticola CBS 122712]
MNTVDIGRCSKRIVQYLWDPEPRNDEDPTSSIWCLGTEYHPEKDVSPRGETPDKNSARDYATGTTNYRKPSEHAWPESFLLDFESRIWMTYRSNFPPIPRVEGDDKSASMTLGSLLANALSTLVLGRDWRRGVRFEEESQLLSLFADTPTAPFSVHRFVKHGAESCGKFPGEWFGPSATAKCIEALSSQCGSPTLKVYVSNDTSEVYQDRFMNVARNSTGVFQPTLILLGTRLGIDHITPVYWDGLKATLQFPQSVGIAGGRPSASHYFVGAQGSHLFYLDPHYTRPALPDRQGGELYSKEEVDTYHTRRLRRIHVRDMDPSMLIGFLIRDQEDWDDWLNRIQAVKGRPIIHVLKQMNPGHDQEAEALDQVEALDDIE